MAAADWKHRLRLVLIPAVTWVASIGVAEVVFRALGVHPTAEMEGLYEPFGASSYKQRPSVETTAESLQGQYMVRTDPLGLRCGGEETHSRPGSTIDALLLGDSQGFGFGLNFEETIAGCLIERASREGVVFRNASVIGHDLTNQFGIARWLTEHERVRVKSFVVLITPFLIYMAGSKFPEIQIDVHGHFYYRDGSLSTSVRRAYMWLRSHTVVVTKVWNTIRFLSPREAKVGLGMYEIDSDGSRQAKLLATLQEFHDWTVKNGSSLCVVYAPFVQEMEFGELQKAAQAKGIAVDRNAPYSVACAVAARLGIPIHDLRPTLANLHEIGWTLHIYGDKHFNASVGKPCAESIWSALLSCGAVSGSR
jgi:hypothetical protein